MDNNKNSNHIRLKKFLLKIDKVLRYTYAIQIPYYIIRDLILVKNKNLEWKEFWLIAGRRGKGKTLALTFLLDDFRKRYGDSIYILTNYDYKGRDNSLTDWSQFLMEYDKPVIFGVDEIHQEFNSRDWKNFPLELYDEISESRKRNKMMISTVQVYDAVDINIRRMAEVIIFPKNFFNRFYFLQFHHKEDFELSQASGKRNANQSTPFKYWKFIAHNELRERYKTREIINPMTYNRELNRQKVIEGGKRSSPLVTFTNKYTKKSQPKIAL